MLLDGSTSLQRSRRLTHRQEHRAIQMVSHRVKIPRPARGLEAAAQRGSRMMDWNYILPSSQYTQSQRFANATISSGCPGDDNCGRIKQTRSSAKSDHRSRCQLGARDIEQPRRRIGTEEKENAGIPSLQRYGTRATAALLISYSLMIIPSWLSRSILNSPPTSTLCVIGT